MKKIKLYFEFYKSVILIYLILIVVSIAIDPSSIYLNLCFFGTAVVYIFKEFYRKNDYYFYYNMNIGKLSLFAFCFGLNFMVSTLILLLS